MACLSEHLLVKAQVNQRRLVRSYLLYTLTATKRTMVYIEDITGKPLNGVWFL